MLKHCINTFSSISRLHGRLRINHTNIPITQLIQQQRQSYLTLHQNHLKQRSEQYYERIRGRRDPRNTSHPQKYDSYEYHTRVNWYHSKQYTTIYRQSPNQQPTLVLDIMKFKQLQKYHRTITLQSIAIDPLHKYIAFGCDLKNTEEITWMMVDIDKAQLTDWRETNVDSVIFVPNGIFYTKLVNMVPKLIMYRDWNLRTQILAYEETQPQQYVSITISKQQQYLFIKCYSNHSSKVYALKPKQFTTTSKDYLISLSPKSPTKTDIYHTSNTFIISRIKDNNCTIHTQPSPISKQQLLHATQPYQMITAIDVFSQHIVLYIQSITKPILRLIHIPTKSTCDIPLPYQIGVVQPAANRNHAIQQFMFTINTPFVYQQAYKYHIPTAKLIQLDQFQLVGGVKFNRNQYQVKTIQVPSQTGDTIPLTILSPTNHPSPKKLLLHVYGVYGISTDVSFTNHYLAALENGWIIAYSHVRGGSEKGQKWHQQGLMKNRDRSWKDLIECVGYLIKQQYTHPSLLFLSTHSAGSVTVWNAINMYPHLFKGVILSYPFLDVLGSLLQENHPLSKTDHEQFGNPYDSITAYNRIQSISPYENIHENVQYPVLFIVGGQNDYRCPIDQIVRFVKRYRQRTSAVARKKTLNNFTNGGIILKVSQDSNHYGSSNLMEQARHNCQILAWMDCLVEEGSLDCTYK